MDNIIAMNSGSSNHTESDLSEKDAITTALELFEITPPFSSTVLKQRYEELLHTWHPHRHANLTNNPTKYMQMYKKGEAKTREVQAAFKTLTNWLNRQS